MEAALDAPELLVRLIQMLLELCLELRIFVGSLDLPLQVVDRRPLHRVRVTQPRQKRFLSCHHPCPPWARRARRSEPRSTEHAVENKLTSANVRHDSRFPCRRGAGEPRSSLHRSRDRALGRERAAMLWRTPELIGYGIQATNGSIGSVGDLLFDDESWTVRWAVVDTGTWLPGRRVLLPPSALGRPDPTLQQFPVDLTRQKVKDSPDAGTDRPVSRQMEAN